MAWMTGAGHTEGTHLIVIHGVRVNNRSEHLCQGISHQVPVVVAQVGIGVVQAASDVQGNGFMVAARTT